MTGSKSIVYRPMKYEEGEKFISLYNRNYNRRKDTGYYKWQFFSAPFDTTLLGAFDGETLVGCFGLQCKKLSNGLVGGFALDLIVDKKYRGLGIFRKMGSEVLNRYSGSIDFGFALSNMNGRMAEEKGLGWKNIYTIRTLLFSGNMEMPAGKPPRLCNDSVSYEWEANRKEFERCLYFIKEKGELAWRFGNNPEYSYSVIADGNGYVVVKLFVDPATDHRFGDIVDFGIKKFDRGKTTRLFQSAVSYLNTLGIERVTAWAMPFSVSYSILKTIGFEETDHVRYFQVGTYREKHDSLYDINNWFLVESDAEIY